MTTLAIYFEEQLEKAQNLVFFMTEIPGGMQILRASESELDALHEKYEFVRMSAGPGGIPFLKQKT